MDEMWEPCHFDNDCYISNKGRVFSFRHDKFLKPKLQNYTIYYPINKSVYSVRTLLYLHFKEKDIDYDIGKPPKELLKIKLLNNDLGVYPNPSKKHPWRFVIAYHKYYFSGSFKTKEEAKAAWVKKYKWLYDLE